MCMRLGGQGPRHSPALPRGRFGEGRPPSGCWVSGTEFASAELPAERLRGIPASEGQPGGVGIRAELREKLEGREP